MFISLRRYLFGPEQEVAAALLRMAQLLLQATRLHAVVGDQTDYEKFQQDMTNLERQLDEAVNPQQILVVAGAVAKTLADYNQRTTRYMRMQSAELQAMLAMLTETVATLAAGSERSVTRLQAIEKQLERASALEDIRTLKAKLSECLLNLREEARRQREEMARTITELKSEIKKVEQRQRPATGKPAVQAMDRSAAERALTLAIQQGAHVYAAVFVVDRVELINGRFGASAAEQLVQFFRSHLAQGLLNSDPVYRWGPSSFVVLMERPYGIEQARLEVQRVASVRLEKTIQIGTRTVLLPITCRWAVVPAFEARSVSDLVADIDAVVAKTTGAFA